jgi:hypothetical protein
MKFVAAIQRLLCVFAILGVILGPASVAMAETVMAASGVMPMDAVPGMNMDIPDAMTDCPNQQSQKSDCGKNCPLALICTSAIFAQMPSDHSWSVGGPWALHRFDMMPHAQPASTLIAPPIRPPKA